jgi:hypothetical protein
MLASEELRHLAALRSERGVLTLAARTDPRDPANGSHDPAWWIEVRNGLREETHRVEAAGDHAAKLAFRALRERAERRMAALDPAECGRSFVWLLADEPALDRFVTLQLPLERSEVRWAPRAHVAPLASAEGLGAPVAAVLLGRDAVRVVCWEAGAVREADGGRFAEAPDDRDLSHSDVPDRRDARVASHHKRFLRDAAHGAAAVIAGTGAEDVVVIGDPALERAFCAELPAELRGRVLAAYDANLHEEPLGALEHRLEWKILAARRGRVAAIVEEIASLAEAGGRGAMGAAAVLQALAAGRVGHLVLDPDAIEPDAAFDPVAEDALNGDGPALLGERAVELALESAAAISVLRVADCDALAQGGGIAAALRY